MEKKPCLPDPSLMAKDDILYDDEPVDEELFHEMYDDHPNPPCINHPDEIGEFEINGQLLCNECGKKYILANGMKGWKDEYYYPIPNEQEFINAGWKQVFSYCGHDLNQVDESYFSRKDIGDLSKIAEERKDLWYVGTWSAGYVTDPDDCTTDGWIKPSTKQKKKNSKK
jgi:hypothetical protein